MKPRYFRRAVIAPVVLFVLLICAAPAALAGKDPGLRAGQVRAMTQNLYVGAEILGVATAPDLCSLMAGAHAAVEQVLANDFQQRADALAALIAADNPEVVGLQEVFQVILSLPDQTPYYGEDYLAMLMASLDSLGADYNVAGARFSAPITVPADNDGDCPFFPPEFALGAADYLGTIIDSDVILCRGDVDCNDAVGANFQFNASADTPGGTITIERGWVSVVATVRGRDYRVVNTHLETDGNDDFRLVQFAQAAELAETLAIMRGIDGLPQIALGDFNSDDETMGPVTCTLLGFCLTSYQVMALAGFTDAWTVRGGRPDVGYTCCQDEDLWNTESGHSRRIDHVWVHGASGHYGGPQLRGVRARVLGTEQFDRTVPLGLWPSDHAGVSADLVIRTLR